MCSPVDMADLMLSFVDMAESLTGGYILANDVAGQIFNVQRDARDTVHGPPFKVLFELVGWSVGWSACRGLVGGGLVRRPLVQLLYYGVHVTWRCRLGRLVRHRVRDDLRLRLSVALILKYSTNTWKSVLVDCSRDWLTESGIDPTATTTTTTATTTWRCRLRHCVRHSVRDDYCYALALRSFFCFIFCCAELRAECRLRLLRLLHSAMATQHDYYDYDSYGARVRLL